MNIFGYGGRPKGKWDNPSSNVYMDGSWRDRDAAVEAARQQLGAMTPGSADALLYNTDTQNASAVIHTQNAAQQWMRLAEIAKGTPNASGVVGGTIVGYDLETFGNVASRIAGGYGVTEVGIGTTVVREGGLYTQTAHSLAVGIDANQKQYLLGILNKYRTQGWAALSNDERVALRYTSMYGHQGPGEAGNYKSMFRQITEEGPLKGMWEVKPEAKHAPDMAIDVIESGILRLADIYDKEHVTPENVVPAAMRYLQQTHESGGVLTGGNTLFDVGWLRKITNGEFDQFIDRMPSKTSDLIYGLRAMADVRTESVSKHQERIHGKRGGGAAIQSILHSAGYGETETHLAASDINQQNRLLLARFFSGDKSLAEDVVQHLRTHADGSTTIIDEHGQAVVKSYDPKKTTFLLQRGSLNKRHGDDIALIDTGNGVVATQNYTIAGEYWEIDTDHTAPVEGGYRLTMVSPADGTTFSKLFASEAEKDEFLRNNADWYDKDEITSEHIQNQKLHKYHDRGRRAFSRTTEAGTVSVDNDLPSGGFADLEAFLEWDKQYGGKYAATPDGFRAFMADMSQSGNLNPNRINQMQEFLGAQSKVADERALLQSMVDIVNSRYGEKTTVFNNMEKTIAFKRAYADAMDALEREYSLQPTIERHNTIMSDISGIDVKMPDGSIKRINAHSVSSATRDVNRIFGGMTREESVAALDSFVASKLISPEKGDELKAVLEQVGIEAGQDAAKRVALERYLGTDSTYQAYVDIGYALHEGLQKNPGVSFTIDNAVTGESGSIAGRVYDYMHRRYLTADGAQTIDALMGNDALKKSIENRARATVNGLPFIPMYDGAETAFKGELAKLTESLGYGRDIITVGKKADGTPVEYNLIEDMFFRPGKKYAAAKQDGIHSIIVRPDENGSAFVLLTNDQHYGYLMDELAQAQAGEIATYRSMSGSAIAQHAAIYELPKVRRYTVGQHASEDIGKLINGPQAKDVRKAEMVVVSQGPNSEKFLIPALDARVYGDDGASATMHAYVNNGVYDLLTAWRLSPDALDLVQASQFEGASSLWRASQDAKLRPLSSSESYRGFFVTDPETGRQKAIRRVNYTPADHQAAFRVQIEDMQKIFQHGLSESEGEQRNKLDIIVDAYGERFGVQRYYGQSAQQYRKSITDTTYFTEFFHKNLFVGTLEEDPVVGSMAGIGNRNLFDILQERVMNNIAGQDTVRLFDDSVAEALQRFRPIVDAGHIYQTLSASAMERGVALFGYSPGDFNVNAGLYATMRPTFNAQNQARLFDPELEWHAADFADDNFKANRRMRTLAGSPELPKAYYDALMQVNLFPGYDKQVSHIMAGFKQMNDNDLQLKYRFLEEHAADMAKGLDVSPETYAEAVRFMRADARSLFEGKWIMDPRWAEQPIISAPDLKKVKLFDPTKIDAQESGKVIWDLVRNQDLITANTIVGYSSTGSAIFAGNNLHTILTEANLYDLFDVSGPDGNLTFTLKQGSEGYTRVIPGIKDINDAKLMLNGAEKATAHAVNVNAFLALMQKNGNAEITSREQALNLLSAVHHHVSDGAAVFGNAEFMKHSNLEAPDTLWRIVETEYAAQGYGKQLADFLTSRLGSDAYAGVKSFEFKNGTIVSETSRAVNPAKLLNNMVHDVLSNNSFAQLNQEIREIIDYAREHDIVYGAFGVMNQNEHVSDGVAVDQRIAIGIQQRAQARRIEGHWDREWHDELIASSGWRTAQGAQYDNLHNIFNFANRHTGVTKGIGPNQRHGMEKGLHGIVESLVYYEDPTGFDVDSKNILKIDLQSMIGTGVIPENGASAADLQGSLFFTDGTPSEALLRLAERQGMDFGPIESSYSNSLYIDLGSYSIHGKDGKSDIHGFLVPIQNVVTDTEVTMFQKQQGRTATMLARVQNAIENPGQKSTAQINAELDKIVREYYQESLRELAVADKNSDYNKVFSRHFISDSGGMLAEQAIAPLVYDPDNYQELQELVAERKALEKQIADRPYGVSVDDAVVNRLDGIYDRIKQLNHETAERVRGGQVFGFTQLKGTGLEGFEIEELADGRKVYSFTVATSRKAFEDQGIHFGQTGMDILADIERGKGLTDSSFIQTALERRASIMEAINKAEIQGLTIQNEATMVQEINEWSKKYGTSFAEFNTKGLNEALAEKLHNRGLKDTDIIMGDMRKVISAFEGLGLDYFREVGELAEFIRYPVFGSQFMARFILDDNMQGNQAAPLTPIVAALMKEDHDGDLLYKLGALNGGSGILSHNAEIRRRQKVYEGGLEYVPQLLAEMIEKGEAYKDNLVGREALEMAAIMEKYNGDKFAALRDTYARAHGVEKLTDAQDFVFRSSKVVRDAFLGMDYNTLTDIRSRKASIAPALRKANIGNVSTTNFNAKTMLLGMIEMYRTAGDTEAEEKASKILEAVTNTMSGKGGFFDMVEQSAIDTKHVWDAMTTAETARYSMGIQLLFGKHAITTPGEALTKQRRVAVEHIISSVYNTLMKDTNKGLYANREEHIQAAVDDIMANLDRWETYDYNGSDIEVKRGIAAIIQMQEMDLPNNLANVQKRFNSMFIRGYDPSMSSKVHTMEEVSQLTEVYRAMHQAEAATMPDYFASNTYYRGLTEFLTKAFSDRSLQTTSDISYAMPATLTGLQDDLVITLNRGSHGSKKAYAAFDVFKVDAKKGDLVKVNASKYVKDLPSAIGLKAQGKQLVFSGANNAALNLVLFGERGFFAGAKQLKSVPRIRNDANIAHASFEAISQAKIAKGINDIVTNTDGSMASSSAMLKKVQAMQDLKPKAQARFGQQEYDTIRRLFSQPGHNASAVTKRASDLMRTYEHARASGQISSQTPGADLLTSINNDIALHPERYSAKSSTSLPPTFDQILESRLIDDHVFADAAHIERIRQSMVNLEGFDVDRYHKVIHDFRSSLYDVQKETQELSAAYKDFLSSNPYNQTQIAKDTQASLEEIRGKFSADLRALNQTRANEAQARVYSLFKNTKQMDTFFGWDGNIPEGSQRVGFGMYLGRSFDSLSQAEAGRVRVAAKQVAKDESASEFAAHAAANTLERLDKYDREVGLSAGVRNIQYNEEQSKILEDALKNVDILRERAKMELGYNAEVVGDATQKSGASSAAAKATVEGASTSAGKTTRQTLRGHLFGQAKGFVNDMGITGKHVGMVAAGLAAIGIANNLLHHQKTGSPLTPAHKPNGSGSPSVEGYYPDAPAESAPPTAGTGKKTVYHSNGLNFRVSANTARTHNARQQAAQMSSITGGSTNVNIQQDTSQVTNNWLENKFADLI